MTEFSPNIYSGSPMRRFVREPAQWRSMTLAALVHGLLLAFLWVGVQWQSQQTMAVEAEVWDMTTRQAAPKAVPEEVVPPQPDKIPEIAPAKVLPKEEPLEDPEIALAQEKKRKLLEKRKQEDIVKAEHEKALKKEQEKEKLAEQKKKADKLLADDAEKKKLLDQKKLQAKEQLMRDKVFADNMRRLAGQASTTGSGGAGDAAKSTGNNRGDPSYAARIGAKVRSNTIFNVTDTSGNNPAVEYKIDLLPDGSLRGPIRKLKSSGVPAFDDAVEKAIEKSMPFPRDKSGEVPPSIVFVHRMKE
ncbi:MAG: cell envelope integrity protein TolA [Undibacterium sp.]|nr:cell envelope integrity protein TolA [Undibacterium sp.]MDO9192331.1 cell envelope integrity protein TolA [Undibacterium sp.]